MAVLYIIFGYGLGSILFASFWGHMIKNKDITKESKDQNPGTANAYLYGGFLCGTLTLICDLAKGFLPVFLYFHSGYEMDLAGAFVLAAPVAGHVFPLWRGFRGGKGIAVTFGCLLGLLPVWRPLFLLAMFFIFFSFVIRVTPHIARTFVTYVSAGIGIIFGKEALMIKLGFTMIAAMILVHLGMSKEKREESQVKLLWMH